MKTKKVLLGFFDDDYEFLNAIKVIRSEGIRIDDAFMPFPVHGFEEALGMKESKLHVGGFWMGLLGLIFAFAFITWISTASWPSNWGGKPNFGPLAWVPILFEVTVLSAAVSMFVAFVIRNAMYPGKQPMIIDERLTNDRFAIAFDMDQLRSSDMEVIKALLNKNGAIEIREAETEKSDLLEIR